MSTPKLTLRHRTVYTYDNPVTLNAHRMMLRPRESPTLQLASTEISVSPDVDLTWAQDVFGNHIATARFTEATDSLIVEAVSSLRLCAPQWPLFAIEPDATRFPFAWHEEVRADLGVLARPRYPDPMGKVAQWVRGFITSRPMDTLTLLKSINTGIHSTMVYRGRPEEGHRTPLETILLRAGACRDFAVLFADAVRGLGFGARLVSGYLYDPDQCAAGSVDEGATHAWVEVFVPGAGWIAFDPTNGRMGGYNLIPVAVGRSMDQLVPLSGSYAGTPGALRQMSVNVAIR